MYKHATLKRAFDLAVTASFILVALPVMLFVAVGVALSSPGPIVFRQERVGRFGRTFTIYKFRSMWHDPGADFVLCSSVRDPRVTPFGRLIRRTHLDELPQLFNVLQGDMSLVGPRPRPTAHEEELSSTFSDYGARLAVRPGLTGPGRLGRGFEDWEREFELDQAYVQNPSVWKDVVILAQTIPLVILGRA